MSNSDNALGIEFPQEDAGNIIQGLGLGAL